MSLMTILRRIQIEPFILLNYFVVSLHGLSVTQLVQDKICLFRYGMDVDYCTYFSQQGVSDLKNQILSDVTTFGLYQTLISTAPVIFWSLFLGAWADRHSKAPKFLICLASLANVVGTVILLLNAFYFQLDEKLILLTSVPSALCGGGLSISMSLYSYIASSIEPQFRTMKFAILEALIFISVPIGIFVGGNIIGHNIVGPNGQLHPYVEVFGIGLIAQILATLWIVFVFESHVIQRNEDIFTERDSNDNICPSLEESDCNSKIDFVEELISENEERVPLIDRIGGNDVFEKLIDVSESQQNSSQNCIEIHTNEDNYLVETIDPSKGERWYAMFNDLFQLQNFFDIVNTCAKRRPEGKRRQIWILIVSLTLVSIVTNGSGSILFQYVQRMYEWNAKTYSMVNSVTFLITSLSVAIVVPVLIKVFKISNIDLSIVGLISVISQNLIRGSILNVQAFYVSYITGSLAYVPMISVRSKLSDIVDKSEDNKVFSLLATFETITPFISSIIYSTLFSATIAFLPSLVFHISAAILIIPLIGFVYIALKWH